MKGQGVGLWCSTEEKVCARRTKQCVAIACLQVNRFQVGTTLFVCLPDLLA